MVPVVYPLVAFAISAFSAWVGSLVALRPLRGPPPLFWVDRARLAYPARSATAQAMIWSFTLAVGSVFLFGTGVRDALDGWMLGLGAVAALLGSAAIALLTERRVRGTTFRSREWLRGLTARLLVLSPLLSAVLIGATLSPDRFDSVDIMILAPCVLLIILGATGAGFMLAKVLGLATPASPRLVAVVDSVASRTGTRPRVVYELHSSAANGLAIPVWKTLIITSRALATLNDSELAAICAHELAHLAEPRAVLMLRLARPTLLFLPIVVARPFIGSFGVPAFEVLLVGAVILLILTRRVGRRMEMRADAAGRTHQGDEGIYAKALERLYEANLVPAVMRGNRRIHPHLYDRLIAAGVQPPYPRPAPPSGAVARLAGLVTLGVAVTMYGVYFTVLSNWFSP